MSRSFDEIEMMLAGRATRNVWDRVCRYCGLDWSGGRAEVWAFAYYDALPSGQTNSVDPVDVVAASALHPGLVRSDLEFFVEHADDLTAWLSQIPAGVALDELDDATASTVGTLVDLADQVTVSLLTKVLHRKRPKAIPLVDRHVLDRYRPVTGERTAVRSYPAIVDAMRSDLRGGAAVQFSAMQAEIARRTGVELSALRLLDIALWTEAWS